VGAAFSAVISLAPALELDPGSEDFVKRFVRLQSDNEKQMNNTSGIYFIGKGLDS
jgi:hypothetical protein